MNRKRSFTLIELLVVAAILAILGGMIFTGISKWRVHSKPANTVHTAPAVQVQDDDAAYKAWVKLTGNPKGLTFDEWKAVKNMNLGPVTREWTAQPEAK
jgi:prepilin-type N-terminal cleavage/methylation domain-containing protein